MSEVITALAILVVIYKRRIKKREGVPTQEEIESMIENIKIDSHYGVRS
jgi:hypothetical protein